MPMPGIIRLFFYLLITIRLCLFESSNSILSKGSTMQQPIRAVDLGISVGNLQAGQWNAITDVSGVRDYAIAFSTAYTIPYLSKSLVQIPALIPSYKMTPLFQAVTEATEEAFYNSLITATAVPRHIGGISTPLSHKHIINTLDHHRIRNP